MIHLLLFFISLSQKQINEQSIVLDGSSDIYASEFIFIATPFGIYTFDRNAETWSRITSLSGLPDNEINIVGLDEGVLWVVTPKGLASADVQVKDWQTYELSGMIQGLTFDDKYVWVGGDFGLKRFDKYTEIWETVTQFKINHMLSEDDYIWFATDSAILRYNRGFEKIERVPQAPSDHFFYIIDTPGRMWFISQNKLVAREKVSNNWSTYEGLKITDYSNLGDSLFAVSEGIVYLYEPRSDNWSRLKDTESLNNVQGIFISGENIFLATDAGLVIYNWNEKSRKLYNRSNGLEIDSLVDVYRETKFIFVISHYDIEFLNTETAIWQVEKFKPVAAQKKKILYLDEAGGHINLLENMDIRLQGTAYYSQSYITRDSLETTDYENINLRLIGQHSSNRLFSLYYDDTDKEQKMYGFSYRGLDDDFLYRCNAGYLRSEYYEFDLIPQFSDSGANAKLKFQEHTVDLQGGYLKSQSRSDFFYGKSITKTLSLPDTMYQKNRFYSIYSTLQPVEKSADTIFVDDSLSSTNAVDTRRGFVIAGITGDFDPLINGTDYFIDYRKGIVHFLNPRGSTDIIVLLIGGQEIVIQSDAVRSHALENCYYVGPQIIPNSLSMIISDTLGQVHSLNTFGIDNNGDGQIDAEFIDHDLGYIIFPQARPFPNEVYDDTLHIYTMEVQFLSQSVFYFLTYTPVLNGSEKVYLDGELMTSGTHYTIDYLSGTLLFLQEDIVSDFSEIEVQYSSVERERQERFYSIQPKISVGNNINIAPGFSSLEEKKIAHMSGKVQVQSQDGMSIRFVPQLAAHSVREWAQAYSLIANYKFLSVNTEYKGFSKGFESFGTNDRRYGKLLQSGTLSASIELFSHVRTDGKFKKEYGIDSLDAQKTIQYTHGRLNYLNPKLPNGYILLSKDNQPDYEKDQFQVNANYNFQLLKSQLKLNSVVRNVDIESIDDNRKRVRDYAINTTFSLPFSVRGDISFRRSNLYNNNSREKHEDEIRGTLNADVVPGLYYIGNYRLEATSFYYDGAQNLILHNYLYNNLNIAPGRWYSPLSIINVSLGSGSNFREYIANLSADFQRPNVLFSPLEDGSPSTTNNLNNYYVTVQLTPSPNVLIWGKHTLNKSGLAYYVIPNLKPTITDEIRFEYESGNLGLFIASWEQTISQGYPVQTTQNVYVEWSKPWSSVVRTKFATDFRLSEDDYHTVSTENAEIEPNIETLLRLGSKSFIIVSLGSLIQKNYSGEIELSSMPSVGMNLNLLTFLYIQCNYESSIPVRGSPAHVLSAKITGKF